MRSVSREGVIMGEVKDLENIGAKTEDQLNQAGIYTKEQLIKAGSKEAWLKIRAFDESACLHLLWGLEGAVEGIKKKDLSPEVRKDLKDFFDDINQ